MTSTPTQLNAAEHFLIQRAQHDIEYKSVGFWFYFINRRFPLAEDWIVIPEQAPDESTGSRRRVDITIHIFNSEQWDMSSLLFVEVKRKGVGLSNVEEQALNAAQRAISDSNLLGVYTITAWGLKYRAWYVSAENPQRLEPVHGSSARNNKQEYLSIVSDEGYEEMLKTIDLIKTNQPLRQAPVVPTQQPPLGYMDQGDGYYDYGEGASTSAYDAGQGISYRQDEHFPDPMSLEEYDLAGQPSTGYTYDQPLGVGIERGDAEQPPVGDSDNEDSDDGIADSAAEPGSKGKEKRRARNKTEERVEVRVRRIPHRFNKDEITFEDHGKSRTTKQDEWVTKKRDGRTIYEYRRKGVIYWCKRLG
jgi:hypothetical protein